MIRVVIVDDSATMRALIGQMMAAEADITVVGEAADPLQARKLIKDLNPDVITLDVEMPGMDGLDFLERIMRLRPMPVVMVSSMTTRGADMTLQALELGAVECISKPKSGNDAEFKRLPQALRAACGARFRMRAVGHARADARSYTPNGHLLAIGSSTGGVEALLAIVTDLPANCPPTVITQHLPAAFTGSFARRLDRACAANVAEAYDGAPLAPGLIYLAPGGKFHLEVRGSGPWHCRLVERDFVNGHRPAVDPLFTSVAKTAGARAIGVILTGMGRDGADGLLAMRLAGARTIGQDEESSIVYGMPRVAHSIGAVQKQAPLGAIAGQILAASNAHCKETR